MVKKAIQFVEDVENILIMFKKGFVLPAGMEKQRKLENTTGLGKKFNNHINFYLFSNLL